MRLTADRSLRGLGVATPQEVYLEPFVGGPYPGIREAAEQLGRVAEVEGLGRRLVHPEAEPRRQSSTILLSPFDPLIRPRPNRGALRLPLPARDLRAEGQARVRLLRAADPAPRSADRPVDPTMDRKASIYRVNAVFAEQGAPESAGPAVAKAIGRLGEWLGAERGLVLASRTRPLARSLRN